MASIDTEFIEERESRPRWLDRARHPDFDAHWQRYEKLVYYFAKYIAKKFKSVDQENLIGTLTLIFNRILYSYDPSRGKFSTYLGRYALTTTVDTFLRYESEAWAVRCFAARTTKPLKKECHVNYSYHEALYHLYRVPEEDDDWIDEIVDCFTDTPSLWAFVTRELNQRDRNILEYRFRDDCTLLEVSQKLKITKERVRQLQQRAMQRIRDKIMLIDQFQHLFR